jgi:hypothetical protein
MLPITSGQKVAIYRNAADAFRPGPTSPGIVEGKIGNIAHYNKNWVTFHICNTTVGVPTLLCVPSSVTNPTLYERANYYLTKFWYFRRRTHTILPPTRAEQTRQSTPSFFCKCRDEERGEGEGDLMGMIEMDSMQATEDSHPSSA